nr:putative glucose-6-phosphate 1-epimerase [Tanacetum cinerariifolium]
IFQFDRVYLGSLNIVDVLDHERKRTYVIRREGLSDDKNGRAAWILLWHPQVFTARVSVFEVEMP